MIERAERRHAGFECQLRVRADDRHKRRGRVDLVYARGERLRVCDQRLRLCAIGVEGGALWRCSRIRCARIKASLQSRRGSRELCIQCRVLRLRGRYCQCRIETEIAVGSGGVDVEERGALCLYVRNLNAHREALRQARFKNEREGCNVVSQIDDCVAERRTPGWVAGQLLNAGLKRCQVRKLFYANRIQREIDAEWLERAVGTAGGVLAVAFVEPGPLADSSEAKDSSRKDQSIIAHSEDALRAQRSRHKGKASQGYSGNADEKTPHRISTGCENERVAFV